MQFVRWKVEYLHHRGTKPQKRDDRMINSMTKAEAYAIHSAALEAAYAIRDLARAQAEIEYRKHDQIMNQAIDAANEALASNAA